MTSLDDDFKSRAAHVGLAMAVQYMAVHGSTCTSHVRAIWSRPSLARTCMITGGHERSKVASEADSEETSDVSVPTDNCFGSTATSDRYAACADLVLQGRRRQGGLMPILGNPSDQNHAVKGLHSTMWRYD